MFISGTNYYELQVAAWMGAQEVRLRASQVHVWFIKAGHVGVRPDRGATTL